MAANSTSSLPSRLSRSLGALSIGLGVPAVLRPTIVARLIGAPDTERARRITAAVGARELVSAAGLLHPRLGPRFTWTRVLGDAMDLALLAGTARSSRRADRTRTTLAVVAALTAVDTAAALLVGRTGHMEVTGTTTVRRSLPDVRAAWRSPAHLPAGEVRFDPAPGDQGTEITVRISYEVPGGRLGRAVARWAGDDPRQQLDDALRRFKQVMETGEVVVSEGAPVGKKAREEFPQHPAQPLTAQELGELARAGVSA
jgi:hypothetical protein